MAWHKGEPRGKKTGGRKLGTPNKRSSDLKIRIEELLKGDDLPNVIFSRLKYLKAEKQIEVLLQLMPYVYPRRKAIDLNSDERHMTFHDFMALAKGTNP